MSHDPAVDAATWLSTAHQSIGTLGTDLFIGPVRAVSAYIPAKAIFVRPEPGRSPDRVFGSTQEIRYPGIQVRVRSTAYSTGREVAMEVFEALQSSTMPDYMDTVNLQSEPVFLRQDDENLYHWSVNATIVYNST